MKAVVLYGVGMARRFSCRCILQRFWSFHSLSLAQSLSQFYRIFLHEHKAADRQHATRNSVPWYQSTVHGLKYIPQRVLSMKTPREIFTAGSGSHHICSTLPFWLVRAHVTQAAALSAPVENEVT
jgi:hypothetical protein